MARNSTLTVLVLFILITSGSMGIGSSPARAASSSAALGFDLTKMDASMKDAYAWAVSRTLSNGTATLVGTSNNLLATSLVGRVLTYVQLGVGNATSLALIQKMLNSEHLLLQNQRYITFGPWAVQDIQKQLQVHRDVQKFLLRGYGLTLDQTARSDFVQVTQDIYLNLPTKYEYFDTLAWGYANALWFAHYDSSSVPPATDFSAAVQDLNLQYNKTAAMADSANSYVDYGRLMHYLVPLEYTDGYFRLSGESLDQSYLSLETQLGNQLLTRQMPNGNISSLKPYKAYLVEDYARDLDSAYYLNHDPNLVSSAFKSESFLTGLYLQPDGNISFPKSGEGFAPIVAYHLVSIGSDIRQSSAGDSYTALSMASEIINRTLSIQSPDGTFRFYTNVTNPGFAYTTIAGVSTIVDSYVGLKISNTSTPGGTVTTSISNTSTPGGTVTTSYTAASSAGNQPPSPSPLPQIPYWVYIAVPIFLLIAIAAAYEARKRTRYRGLVDK